MIEDLLSAILSWRTFLLALLVFGFAPGALLRVIVLAFRRDDPRRRELLAELHAVPHLERPFWVFEQLEVALFEGLWERFVSRAKSAPLALLVFGLVMVLSASSVIAFVAYGDSYRFFKRQVGWVLLGLAVMLAVSRVDYRRWRRLGAPLLALSTLGLVFVLVHPSSISAYGVTRWIPLPGGQLVQPAEFAKLALLLFAADVLTRKAPLLADLRHLLVPVLPVTLVLAVLIMAEPDLSTTVLLVAIAFGLLFLADAPLVLLAGVGAVGLAGGLGLVMGAGYRFIQGRLAVDPGGLLGVGLGASRQRRSLQAHTDFIFAFIGKELGLLGIMAIVLLFVALAYAGIRVAQRAADPFGRYLAGGATVWMVVQALVNIGAVAGVLPITGVPLPLHSFSGSSMLVLLAAIGMLLNVARQEATRAPVLATPGPAGRRHRPN